MVNLNFYSGKWFEIYVQNAYFEIGCSAATANYNVIPEGLSVVNKCYSETGTGEIYTFQQPYLKVSREIKGVAKPTASPDEFDLTFETGQKGIYKIFYTNYYFSIVGTLGTNYVSILSRNPYVSEECLAYYLNLAKSYGFRIVR